MELEEVFGMFKDDTNYIRYFHRSHSPLEFVYDKKNMNKLNGST